MTLRARALLRLSSCLLAGVLGCGGTKPAAPSTPMNADRADAAARLESAGKVVEDLRADVDAVLPRAVAGSAHCVAVVPSLLHAGLVVGVRGGRGVFTCREANGWSSPDFFRLSGATAGLMAGVQSIDLVMLVMSSSGKTALLDGKMQVGADTSIVAGPVGRTAQASTEVLLRASIIYYSRSQGLFVGIDLSGTALERDEEASRAFYGDPRDFGVLLRGPRPAPPEAATFRTLVERAFPLER